MSLQILLNYSALYPTKIIITIYQSIYSRLLSDISKGDNLVSAVMGGGMRDGRVTVLLLNLGLTLAVFLLARMLKMPYTTGLAQEFVHANRNRPFCMR